MGKKNQTELHPDGYNGDFVVPTTGEVLVRGDGVFGGLRILTSEAVATDEIAYQGADGRWHVVKLPARERGE